MTDHELIIGAVTLIDRLASLVERLAATTPDDRDRVSAREVAIDAGHFYVKMRKANP